MNGGKINGIFLRLTPTIKGDFDTKKYNEV